MWLYGQKCLEKCLCYSANGVPVGLPGGWVGGVVGCGFDTVLEEIWG